MPSQNALLDIIRRNPVGTSYLQGIQNPDPTAEPGDLWRSRVEDVAPLLFGFGTGTKIPKFQNMRDYIRLLNTLRLTEHGIDPPHEWGWVELTPFGKRRPMTQSYVQPWPDQDWVDYWKYMADPSPRLGPQQPDRETVVDDMIRKLLKGRPGFEEEQ